MRKKWVGQLSNMSKIIENTKIIVANTDWPLPESLMVEIKAERMVSALLDMAKPNTLDYRDLVGWAECIAYLMPATQKKVLSYDMSKIYLYCVYKLMERKGVKDLDFLEQYKILSDNQIKKLNEIKRWIYENRGGRANNPILSALKKVFLNN